MGPEDYQELQNSDKLDGKKKLLAFFSLSLRDQNRELLM